MFRILRYRLYRKIQLQYFDFHKNTVNPCSHKLNSQKYDFFAIILFITIINSYKPEKY